jgi:3-oxoacyl-[acyl-carrier-protein] synthase III
MPRARFLGTGFAVPDRVVTNDDLSHLMDTSDQWIRTRTGIQERRWAREGDTGAALAHAAALRALDAAGLEAGAVDVILYATSTPDHFAPGNGVFLQRLLGLGPIPSIDVRNQCSGFVYALAMADAFIRCGQFRHVLVIGAEIQSTAMDVTTRGRNTAVIFADGAGAAILGPSDDPERGILAVDLHGDGAQAEKLWVDCPGSMYHPRVSPEQIEQGRHFLVMDGKEVFRHAVVRMPESVQAALAAVGHTTADLKLLVAHQANLRIAEMIQKTLGLRDDQIYNNIMWYGNTTAATIPIALDECVKAGRIAPGDLIALTAFGSGFLWGSAVVRW